MSGTDFSGDGAFEHADITVQAWLFKAVGDYRTAIREIKSSDRTTYDAVCFHAQQGAEKLIKAALIGKGSNPPKVHDLVHLDALLRRLAPQWSFPLEELSELSSAAVEVRYPGFTASREDAERAVGIALRLWDALRPLV